MCVKINISKLSHAFLTLSKIYIYFFIYKIKIIGSMFYNKTISDFLLQNVMFNLKCYWLFLSIKIILKETYYAPFYNM